MGGRPGLRPGHHQVRAGILGARCRCRPRRQLHSEAARVFSQEIPGLDGLNGKTRVLQQPLASVIAVALLATITAQSDAPQTLDARGSDPVAMGWMVGAPPPPDKLIRFSDGSWFRFPQTRWSFSNIRQLMPTSVVGRSSGQ